MCQFILPNRNMHHQRHDVELFVDEFDEMIDVPRLMLIILIVYNFIFVIKQI